MAQLQGSLHDDHKGEFYKGAILSQVTLHGMGFEGCREIRQMPGDIVASHNYHFGLGFSKIAEAHSWFSQPWHMLNVSHSPELPVCYDVELPEGWAPTEVVELDEDSLNATKRGKRKSHADLDEVRADEPRAKRVRASDDDAGAAASE